MRRIRRGVCGSLLVAALALASPGCGGQLSKPAPDLIKDLKDPDEAVRMNAARDLAKAAGADEAAAVEALAGALSDKSPYVRANAAQSLGAFGSRAGTAVPALKRALKDSDEKVRLEAAGSLKKIEGG
jgi:HEAT repeat protein